MQDSLTLTSRNWHFVAALLLAIAGTFVLGTSFAHAFTCTEAGCNDYAEGYCAWHGGLHDSDFDNPTCEIRFSLKNCSSCELDLGQGDLRAA